MYLQPSVFDGLVLSRLYKLTFAGIGVAGAAVHEKARHISKTSFLVSFTRTTDR